MSIKPEKMLELFSEIGVAPVLKSLMASEEHRIDMYKSRGIYSIGIWEKETGRLLGSGQHEDYLEALLRAVKESEVVLAPVT